MIDGANAKLLKWPGAVERNREKHLHQYDVEFNMIDRVNLKFLHWLGAVELNREKRLHQFDAELYRFR